MHQGAQPGHRAEPGCIVRGGFDAKGTAGAALYTDRQYDIVVAKSDAMRAYIEECGGCSVLAYDNSLIAETDPRMPSLVAA